MRRIVIWALSTVSALVLLFSYHTSTSASMPVSVQVAPQTPGTTSESGGVTDTTPTPTSSATTTSGTSRSSSTVSGTFLGAAVMTRFGAVQVQITVSSGVITKSVVTQVPWTDHRDQEINSAAVPILNAEALDAQSAKIDMVSGATYTSAGYIQSLQSAIDQAGL